MGGGNTRRVRRQGPVTLRGKQIPATTTDQRLLDRRGPSDWVHTDPWRVMRIQAEFVEGFGLLAELGIAVSVFGSARTKPGTPEYQLADDIAGGLVGAGYAIITGGGPGIMEAANSQAFVVLPGGFGTMDELFEAMTLVATGKITKFPIVLVGSAYWAGLIDWLRDTMLAEGKIGEEEMGLFHLADTADEVVKIIKDAHEGLSFF
jgi:predicted Rossmann-fold nucleotide-binding protein